jgi:hypothetical protein
MKSSLLTEQAKKAIIPNQWELLRLLAPPQLVIHIGAGSGKGELHQWRQWQVPNALLIEADEARLEWANSSLAENPQWDTACVVLSDVNAEADFYTASNPAEDGLIAAEQLRVLWPNLSTREQQKRQVQRLDGLLQAEPYQALQQAQTIWTIIDCLTSLTILKGAGHELEKWSVLCVRVLLKSLAEENTVGTLQDIEAYLLPYGYRCIEITESNNPVIGSALFVRDWQAVLQSKNEQLSQNNSQLVTDKLVLLQQLIERQAAIDALTQERDQFAQQATGRQTQLEALTQAKAAVEQEKASLIQSRDALGNEVTALSQVCDQQTQLVTERQVQIETLSHELTNNVQQVQQLQSQVEALSQTNTLLNQEKSAFAEQHEQLKNELAAHKQTLDQQALSIIQSITERDQLQAQLEQHEAVMVKLKDQYAESDIRQRLLNDEMFKAEAQLELIKDVLLREPGL